MSWTCGRCGRVMNARAMHCSGCGWSPMTQPTVLDSRAFRKGPNLALPAIIITAIILLLWLGWYLSRALAPGPEAELLWQANAGGTLRNLTGRPLEGVTITFQRSVPIGSHGFITGATAEPEQAAWDEDHAAVAMTIPPHGDRSFFFVNALPPDFPPAVLIQDRFGHPIRVRQVPPP